MSVATSQQLERLAGWTKNEIDALKNRMGLPAIGGAEDHAAGTYEPVITAGTSVQYWRGDKSWQTLNQAAIPELTTASSPAFVTVKLSGLTDGYVPYQTAAGLANSGLFWDNTNGYLGIANASPVAIIHANSNASAAFYLDTYATTATGSSQVVLRKARGTASSPTQSLSNDRLGNYGFSGFDNAGSFTGQCASISVFASEDYTTTARGSYLKIELTPTGSTSRTEKLRVTGEGNLGLGITTFGTSATKTHAVGTGVAPSTSPADAFQFYSADQAAGNACAHFRTENGGIVKLYTVVDARCDDAINSGDATTDGVIDAIRDALILHGLLAAA